VSYCRNDGVTSDVYVIRHFNGSLCCYCSYAGNEQWDEQGMIDHLREHIARGEKVPDVAFQRLTAERDGYEFKTDVQIALDDLRAHGLE
jgi:hypothetical protein